MKERLLNNPLCVCSAEIGIGLILFLHPLFMTNRYYNLTLSKFLFFFAAACVVFITSFLFYSVERKNKTLPGRRTPTSVRMAWIFLIFSGIASVLVSPDKPEAIIGSEGRYLGFLFYAAVFLLFLTAERFFVLEKRLALLYLISAVLVMMLAVMERFELDLFGLIATVPSNQKGIFLSTIGNTNVFGSFLSVSLPVGIFLFAESDRKILPVLSAVLGSASLFAASSDSGFLGLTAVLWLLVVLSFSEQRKLFRISVLCTVFFFVALLYGVLLRLGAIKVQPDGAAQLLSNLSVAGAGLAVFLVLSIVLHMKHVSPLFLRRARFGFLVLSVLLFAAVLGSFLYFSFLNRTTDLRGLENYLRFSAQWGNERGEIWTNAIHAYARFPLLNLLFGYGQDNFYFALADFLPEIAESRFVTDNAHNELLQYLLTTGAVGLLSYLAVLVVSIKTLLKNRKRNPLYGAVLLCVTGYLAQSVVNISQAITTPLFFTLLIVGSCADSEPDCTTPACKAG